MISLLVPVRCVGCGVGGTQLCGSCIDGLSEPEQLEVPEGLDSCAALFRYEGVGRRVVGALKFRGERSLARVMGAAMARLVCEVPFDVVTWAPTTARRRRSRGFDQAAELAHAVSKAMGLPARPMLVHAGGGGLTGRSRAERQGAVSFRPLTRRRGAHGLGIRWARAEGRNASRPSGLRVGCNQPEARSVVLVDDVLTTGATLSAAAQALREGGAHTIHGLVLAATPRPGRPMGDRGGVRQPRGSSLMGGGETVAAGHR